MAVVDVLLKRRSYKRATAIVCPVLFQPVAIRSCSWISSFSSQTCRDHHVAIERRSHAVAQCPSGFGNVWLRLHQIGRGSVHALASVNAFRRNAQLASWPGRAGAHGNPKSSRPHADACETVFALPVTCSRSLDEIAKQV
jgi:hypothetical protein